MKFSENHAIYLQIADYFCENILQKKWEEGAKIPSIREVAVQVEVNPNTAMRTFNYLQDKGIIYNKRGIGYFVAEDGFEKTLQLKKEQFVQEALPQMFRTMELLRMNLHDLEQQYEVYRQQNDT
ncbi:MAG TPA: GntR family transcriptional regulator [Bacteroidales bacterium]|nr:GntR family transcriptional regulator [Bacteroidales bacterium]